MEVDALPKTAFGIRAHVVVFLFCCLGAGPFCDAQTPTPTPATDLPKDILNTSSVEGTSTTFDTVPSTTSLTVTVDITDPSPGNLRVTIFPGNPEESTGNPRIDPNGDGKTRFPTFVIWDHEPLVDALGQPLSHIHAVAVLPQTVDVDPAALDADPLGKVSHTAADPCHLPSEPTKLPFLNASPTDPPTDPPTFTYTVRVIHDGFGDFQKIGTFDACSLIVNPSNPGHIASPTINLFGSPQQQTLPTQINYGDSLNLFATALGDPSSYKIDRLGIVINGNQTFLDHGVETSAVFNSQVVSQPASATSGASIFYQPPVLSPGDYTIETRAVDAAGFSNTICNDLTVRRRFGLFSISNLVTTINADSTDPNCPECNSTNFTATIRYQNDTDTDSADLRIRLVEIASASFVDDVGPPSLPDVFAARGMQLPPRTPANAFVGFIHPLQAHTADQVTVSGVVAAPFNATTDESPHAFINFHVYAVLDELIGGQWTPIDSFKVIDGVQKEALGTNGGPGDGVNGPPGSTGTGNQPFVLDHVVINGPTTLADSSKYNFTATAVLKSGTTTTNRSGLPTQWSMAPSLPGFTLDPASGLLQAGHVTTNTIVQISGMQTVGGVTKTNSVSVTVEPSTFPPTPSLSNISTRALVQTGDQVLIGGFVINGSAPKHVLIRAIGPSLGGRSVPNPLQDPVLTLHLGLPEIDSNDDWQSHPNAGLIPANLQPTDSRESAILTTLQPGSYTAIVTGKNSTTGVGLVEVYDMDSSTNSVLTNISTRGIIQTGDFVMIGGFVANGISNIHVLIRAIGPSLAQFGISNCLPDATVRLINGNGMTVMENDNWRDTQEADIQATNNAPTNNLESAILTDLAPGSYTAIVSDKNGASGVGLVEVFKMP